MSKTEFQNKVIKGTQKSKGKDNTFGRKFKMTKNSSKKMKILRR